MNNQKLISLTKSCLSITKNIRKKQSTTLFRDASLSATSNDMLNFNSIVQKQVRLIHTNNTNLVSTKVSAQPPLSNHVIDNHVKSSTSTFHSDLPHQVFSLPQHADELTKLLTNNPTIQIQDTIELQLRDLVKLENPTLYPMSEDLYQSKIVERLQGQPIHEFGNWVYYPWRNSLVHVLNEADFVSVRTIRNAFKISPEEQQALKKKTVLVVGLSVGQAAAMVLAMERSCGHLILTDFDHLELSNMNRLRASVMDLGILKGTVIRRAIAELDPYLKVTFLQEGLSKKNISQVLGTSSESKNVDLIIEECDNFDVKVLIRKHCKEVQIPVVMETSDRGMLDVERFDLDKDYPILHGLIKKEMLEIEQFTPEHKMQLTAQFLDVNLVSRRGLFSFGQIGKTLTSWPQLASEVTFGSSVAAMVTRMILLGEKVPSQRQYLDIPQKVSTFESK